MSMRLRAAVIWRQKGGQKRLLRDDACVVCARHAAPDIERVGRACRRRLFGSGSITDRVVAKEAGIGESAAPWRAAPERALEGLRRRRGAEGKWSTHAGETSGALAVEPPEAGNGG